MRYPRHGFRSITSEPGTQRVSECVTKLPIAFFYLSILCHGLYHKIMNKHNNLIATGSNSPQQAAGNRTRRRLSSRLLKNSVCRLLKKTQRRSARNSHMADSLWHIVGTIRYRPYAISQPGARRLMVRRAHHERSDIYQNLFLTRSS
jgi:hypothetical protein